MPTKRMLVLGLVGLLAVVLAVVVYSFWQIKFGGTPVPVPDISREARVFGQGQPLRLALLGDSRIVGQGGDYEQGIAVSAARHLASNREVTMYNFGVSGARSKDVMTTQSRQAADVRPDMAVIVIGANDITHMTDHMEVLRDLETAINTLLAANCDMKIVLSDPGAMWVAARIPHPLRYIAGVSSKRLASKYVDFASKMQLTFAPIGAETGYDFVHDRSNLAADKFHPSDKGYKLLSDALLPYLDQALKTQPSHCIQPASGQ